MAKVPSVGGSTNDSLDGVPGDVLASAPEGTKAVLSEPAPPVEPTHTPEEASSLVGLKYTGGSDVRSFSVDAIKAIGGDHEEDLVFNAENEFQVSAELLSDETVAALMATGEFQAL